MNRERVDALLDTIDGALGDDGLSDDAMRWMPDGERTEANRPDEDAVIDLDLLTPMGSLARAVAADMQAFADRVAAAVEAFPRRDVVFRFAVDSKALTGGLARAARIIKAAMTRAGRLPESRADSARRRHITHQMRIMSRRAARRRSRG